MRTRILIVAPGVSLRARLGRLLTTAGYGVELAENAAHARRIGFKGFNLSIVAPEGLGPDGRTLVAELRTATKLLFTSASPISPKAGPDVLDLSDDSAVLARVAETLRPPSEDKSTQLLRFAGHSLDLAGHSLTDKGGTEIPLTRGEFRLLREFAERPGRVLSRNHLSNVLNGRNAEAYDRGVDMLIVRLRRKIEADSKRPALLVTVPGSGYKLAANVEKAEAPGCFRATPVDDAAAAPQPWSGAEPAPRLSLVILPFANLSGEPEQDCLADAITEDLTTDLSRLDHAFVIGRSSARAYGRQAVDARRAGRELGARYIVQGTVRRVGEGRVRVNAELVSAETGASLWADRFDQEVHDPTEAQRGIVRRLGTALEVHLVDAESECSLRERPDNPEAFDLALQARSHLHRTFSLDQARKTEALLERALTLDPCSIPAMVQLVYCLMVQNDKLAEWKRSNMLRALTVLQAAEDLCPDALEVVALRAAMLFYQGRCTEGSAVYERVLSINSSHADVQHQIGTAKP